MNTNNKSTDPAYKVTPVDNFDFYDEDSEGTPIPCRDAEHALSVAKAMIERSLAHEHAQAKDPTDPEELIERWDDFGSFPSIHPELDPPFNPSDYVRMRAVERCAAADPQLNLPLVKPSADSTAPISPHAGGAEEDRVMLEERPGRDEDSQDDGCEEEPEEEESDYDPGCYAFAAEDAYPVEILITAIQGLTQRKDLSSETAENLKAFLFAMERLPLVTPGLWMMLTLRIDAGGESDWVEILMEDCELSFGQGRWTEGDAHTETFLAVTPDYREGNPYIVTHFAESFAECATDECREVVVENYAAEPFTDWHLKPDKSRWASLPRVL